MAKPDGLLVVPPDEELDFLHPLPVERLWGVGQVTAGKLHDRGITTVAEVAQLAETTLVSILGRASGRHLHALAHNRDPRPVEVGRPASIHRVPTRPRLGPALPREVDATLVGLVDRVTRRMRAAGRVGRTVTLRLRFDDFSRATRSHTLAQATADTRTVLTAARTLLHEAQPIDRRQRPHPGGHHGRQPRRRPGRAARPALRLRDRMALDAALDDVRERFGSTAVTRAVLLGRDTGLVVPLLPD